MPGDLRAPAGTLAQILDILGILEMLVFIRVLHEKRRTTEREKPYEWTDLAEFNDLSLLFVLSGTRSHHTNPIYS